MNRTRYTELPRRLAVAMVCAAVLQSCQEYYNSSADFWSTDYRMTPSLPANQARQQAQAAPGYPVAPDWVATDAGFEQSSHHEEFQNRLDYRVTLRTWKNDALMHSPGHKRVVIDLSKQRGLCLVNGQVAMDFPVCTGMGSHHTPVGSFRISQKDVNHWSNLYHCPMPYFMRLTGDGIGLHVGEVRREPASHGCIRVTRDACIALFNALPSGTEVTITR